MKTTGANGKCFLAQAGAAAQATQFSAEYLVECPRVGHSGIRAVADEKVSTDKKIRPDLGLRPAERIDDLAHRGIEVISGDEKISVPAQELDRRLARVCICARDFVDVSSAFEETGVACLLADLYVNVQHPLGYLVQGLAHFEGADAVDDHARSADDVGVADQVADKRPIASGACDQLTSELLEQVTLKRHAASCGFGQHVVADPDVGRGKLSREGARKRRLPGANPPGERDAKRLGRQSHSAAESTLGDVRFYAACSVLSAVHPKVENGVPVAIEIRAARQYGVIS